jgi:hypothetical protein
VPNLMSTFHPLCCLSKESVQGSYESLINMYIFYDRGMLVPPPPPTGEPSLVVWQ